VIDHVELFVADPAQSVAFFRAALSPLGYSMHVQGESNGFGADAAHLDFWLRKGGPSQPLPHVAFNCASRAAVEASHAAALTAGGRDNGAPKLLLHIHPHYYAAFVRDPDGHNIEFVCHRAIA
jgi:catechol 2,3-dioxygenase-like lactoylglutathione lyase family enzyme